MGLDMYLYKKNYVKNWEHTKPEELHQITIKKGGKKAKNIDPKKIIYIVEEAGYWRKANAIHNWFVKNVQNGEDDCKDYYVDQDQLKELLEIVNKVIANSKLIEGKIKNGYTLDKDGKEVPIMVDGKYIEDTSTAEKLLPTMTGFFYGGCEYDEYYYQDLINTKKIIEEALKDESAYFEYTSSW